MTKPSDAPNPLSSPCDVMPHCPICAIDAMALAHRQSELVICVCLHCGTTLSVPTEALAKLSRSV